MLAESQSTLGWLVFLALMLAGVIALPGLARALRSLLPRRRRAPFEVEAASFGRSQKALRSARHAIRFHRSLLTALFTAILAVLLVPCLAALRSLGVVGLQAALGLALPVLLVTLHARHRSPGS